MRCNLIVNHDLTPSGSGEMRNRNRNRNRNGNGNSISESSGSGVKRGPWTAEEDEALSAYIRRSGEGRWRSLPQRAGLLRCGKSCRLRWMNYLRPDVKRGHIAPDEEDLILRLHRLLGNRWSLIAGRLPGRTDNEIKNYWNTHLSKKLIAQGIDPATHKPRKTPSSNPNPIPIPIPIPSSSSLVIHGGQIDPLNNNNNNVTDDDDVFSSFLNSLINQDNPNNSLIAPGLLGWESCINHNNLLLDTTNASTAHHHHE